MAPKRQYTMKEVFEECQQGLHTHNKLMTALQKNYKQTEDKAAFNDEFVGYLKYSMVIFKRESAVERTLDFVAKFAASFAVNEEEGKENQPDADNTFLTFLFDFLLKSHNGRDRAVRFRACQMINKLLTSLGEEAQIDDDLYDRIYRCMLARVQDKFPAVRVQAVMALARLQDPEDPDCPVIKAYLYLMEKDVNFEVRRTVLSCIAPASQTLPAILERTRDVKDTVRKMAYQVLAEKVHIRALTISQRIKVLQAGLTDHLDMVKDICTGKMLQSWLRTFDGNAIDLLKRMDVENSCTTAELALKAIFEKVPASGLVEDFDLLNEDLVIPIEELSCENVLYWCCLVEHVRSKGDEALMDKLMPTASAFCDYVHKNCDKLEISCHNVTAVEHTLSKEFVSEHLLKMTGSLDQSDEVGRKKLDSLVQDLLIAPHVPPSLVAILITRLKDFHSEDEERIELMAQIISDIRVPITTVEKPIAPEAIRQRELKLASIRMDLTQARDALEDTVANQDFTKAAEMKRRVEELECTKNSLLEESLVMNTTQEIRTEKSDPETLLKCLTIAAELMQHLAMKELNPTLQTLFTVLVLPGITNEDPSVRNMAVKCLGLGAQISRVFAMQQLLLLMQISQVDQETVQVTALQAIFDTAQTYGLDIFKLPETSSEKPGEDGEKEGEKEKEEDEEEEAKDKEQSAQSAANSALSILTKLLDSESNELRTVSAEGLAKLLLSGRITSPKLLSRLLLLWYNPTSEEDQHLRSCLGAFFPVYSFAGRVHQECWEEAFLPTLRTLFNAPTTSPMAKVNPGNVAEFMVHLTDHTMLNNKQTADIQETTVHDNLALKLCNAILEDPTAPGTRVLAKTLSMLTINAHNQTHLADIKVLADLLVQHVEEKVALRQVEKFSDSIDTLLGVEENQDEGGKTEDGTAAQGADMLDKENETGEKADETMAEAACNITAAQELSEDCKKDLAAGETTGKKTRARGKSTKTPAQKKPTKTPSTRGRRKAAVKEENTSDHENESDLVKSKVKGRVKTMSKLAELVMSSDDSDAEFQSRARHTKRDQVLKVLNFADDDSC
ncbi:condensin complex subunit 3-like isoform X1 [Strongylocentrotus purpuratus]|uniref:Nuclear condensin complex subunit 3 C-terminal domain-containing protein n=2 Tax=Strongylocentrotus purpuratus TaxID=7668 RepID=A0A7M7PFD4_STRPU|nr:condensin complex subunit 3-like isoform X1 [Strongylocentrotus purpuratus]